MCERESVRASVSFYDWRSCVGENTCHYDIFLVQYPSHLATKLFCIVMLLFCKQTGHSKNGGLRHVLQEGEARDRWRVPSLRRVRGQTSCVVHRPPHRHLRWSGGRDGCPG